MDKKICMITGANSGIGYATSLGLARQGLEIVMVCRSRERGEAAQKEIISRTGNSFVHLMMADLSSQKSIRDFVAEFKKKFNSLHILINNAGISPFKRELSVDGIEMAFATNHLGPFLLTNLLLDVLKSSAPARIINIASIAHRGAKIKINFDDLQGEVNYDGGIAYGQSKLANILYTTGQLVDRLALAHSPTGISKSISMLGQSTAVRGRKERVSTARTTKTRTRAIVVAATAVPGTRSANSSGMQAKTPQAAQKPRAIQSDWTEEAWLEGTGVKGRGGVDSIEQILYSTG